MSIRQGTNITRLTGAIRRQVACAVERMLRMTASTVDISLDAIEPA